VDEALDGGDHRAATGRVLDWLAEAEGLPPIAAAGHRIVHGGGRYDRPVRVTPALIADLRGFIPFAPRHQPHNIAGIEALAAIRPDLPQIACFDTAFHAHMPPVRQRLPIPRALHEKGVRRYGFHGLSYQSIVARFERIVGAPLPARSVIAHLGAGASLAGVLEGRGVYTSMGFSPLDGLVMASRPGRLDPGVLLHLMRMEAIDAAALERLLYDACGLVGVSGLTGDMKTLMASGEPAAGEAIALYIDRLAQEIGAAAAALDGIDALIFTGGVGENAAPIRARTLDRLGWLGFRLDTEANGNGGPRLTMAGTEPAAYRVPTDEERVIAEACRTALDSAIPENH
jgi:acetate kinase